MKVVVVGGGVVGLTSAYRLAAAGCEVTLLDAGRLGAAASHGNAAKMAYAESGPVPAPGVLLQGIRWMLKRDSPLAVRPSLAPGFVKFMLSMARHCNEADFTRGLELHLRLADDANDLLDDYVRDGVDFEMHSAGVLLAFETRDRFAEQCASLPLLEEFGMPGRKLDRTGIDEVEPVLAERIRYGLYFTRDRQIEPDSLTRGLTARCRALGVDIRENTAVARFERSGHTVTAVVTNHGESIALDELVLAAGVWSGPLSKQLGVPLPIHPGKGYSIDYRPAPVQLTTSLTLEDARVAVTPLNGMLRLAGTMEFGRFNDHVDPVRVEAIRRAARENLVGWGDPAGEAAPWAGLRPMTPDGLPIIGRFGGLANACVASGHGMLGLTLAPATAEIVTDLVTGRTGGLPADVLTAVSPDRFRRRRPGAHVAA